MTDFGGAIHSGLECDVAIIGIPYDDKSSFLKGPAKGPQAIREASTSKMINAWTELGVDLEKIRPDFISEQIPEQFFSPQEVAKLRALPITLQEKAFFRCWTRKEAYFKAKGGGLSFNLNQFEVSFTPGEPAAILNIFDDPKEKNHWSLIDIDLGPDYAAALAVEEFGLDLRYLLWENHVLDENNL
jgi:4'-phosphopantetheinyl transferase